MEKKFITIQKSFFKADELVVLNTSKSAVEKSDLVLATKHHNGGSKKENPLLSIEPGMVLWTWVVFFMLLALLAKFAWRPILKTLKEREEKIVESLKNADRLKKESEKITEKNQLLLKKAKKEAEEIINNSKKNAQKLANEVKEKTKMQVDQMIKEAKISIKAEKNEMKNYIKSESVQLGLKVASKLLGEKIDQDADVKLAEKYLEKINPF